MKRIIEIFVAGKKAGHIQYELTDLEPGVTYSEPTMRVKVSGEIPAMSPPTFSKFDNYAKTGKDDAEAFDNYIAHILKMLSGEGAHEFGAILKVPADSVTFKVGPKDGSAPSDSSTGLWVALGLGLGAFLLFGRRKKAQ